ncbi:nuclear transport factor 2 family protein [Anabaena sp. UHCC 0451]|uniref:nuclear transport factor 2 family protein n=1 Tax=Anabaena sp. UHCC 0451 TaxID=2055235 RepID=UPI002B1F9DD8|nr:nuclear transport factor 2 family protein [Anabaena sp. UHCC 0451]MEA5574981.1 nuclear transport factor 2 family protein [Anabaena sp. UHCC 0451]
MTLLKNMPEQQNPQTETFTSKSSTLEMFPGVRAGIIKQILAASDEMNIAKSLQLCTDNVVYKFGNLPMVVGKQAIKESSAGFLQNFQSIKHNIISIWESGETIIVEMEVSYTRHDNKMFNLPCCNVFSMEGDMVQDMRIYMDISPVFT